MVQISRVLHAGYLFECDGTIVIFDPIFENPFSRNCFAFPKIDFDLQQIKKIKLDAIFISHFHDDHCSFESLNLLDRNVPIYIYCIYDQIFEWLRQLGFLNVYALDLNLPIQVGPFTVIPRRALDADVDSIFHIAVKGLNILNVVDSWMGEDTLKKLLPIKWDLVLWPFQTMREIEVLSPLRADLNTIELPNEWLQQLQKLDPKVIVPSSCQFIHEDWSWYNNVFFPITYRFFLQKVLQVLPRANIVRMNPGVTFQLTENTFSQLGRLPWIIPVGDENADYSVVKDLVIPTTAEIAKNFLPLSLNELEKVLQFCKRDLLTRFEKLPLSEEPYFQKPVKWQLNLYDHTGKVISFFYYIHNEKINILSEVDSLQVNWLTDVALTKICSALFYGEALTSMYLRVNDRVFNTETEKQLCDTNIMDDPLIRVLFTENFGSYQKYQMKRF